MAELRFVLVTFMMSCAVVCGLQYEVKGRTLEARLEDELRHGTPARWMKEAGQGAVRGFASTVDAVKKSNIVAKKTELMDQAKEVRAAAENYEDQMNEVLEKVEEQ